MPGGWTRLRWTDLALVFVLAGTVLRVWRWAANRPLWLDEEMIAMNLRDRGFAQLTGELHDNQSAPLGWLWLQRLLVDLFGTGERTLRLVPLLFGIGALLIAWLVGRRYLGPVGAVALVGFCAVNDAFVRYSAEVKHYSADTFAVLAMLGLAAWVVERPTLRRAGTWWAVAAVGGWFSMGATLATPGLALVLVGSAWWRRRWARAHDVALPGAAWLASFAVQYQLSLRFTAGSDYLANFWDGLGYPPRSGPLAVARWLMHRPAALAADPLHLDAGLPGEVSPKILGGLFWLLVAAGLVVAVRRRPAYGLLLAAPMASALALAVLRIVPLALRLALWMVPALFAAAAVALDAAAALLASARRRAPARPVASARRLAPARPLAAPALARARAAIAVGALVPLMGLVPLGTSVVESTAARPAVDDRGAVAFMRAVHQRGDLVLAVGSATRALHWYDPGQRLRPWRMALPTPPGRRCDPAGLVTATARYKRVIAYSGIRAEPYTDAPRVLARRLGEIGAVVETRRFGGGESIVYVVERHPRPPSRPAGGACIVAR
jgi:Dolichyl-phosphate-mannose-protein mannosyltransferase